MRPVAVAGGVPGLGGNSRLVDAGVTSWCCVVCGW